MVTVTSPMMLQELLAPEVRRRGIDFNAVWSSRMEQQHALPKQRWWYSSSRDVPGHVISGGADVACAA